MAMIRKVKRSTVVNCGATTPFVAMVSIRATRDKERDEDVVFASDGRLPIRLFWTDYHTLTISCETCDKFTKVRRIVTTKGVYGIKYGWLPPKAG